MQCSVSQVQIRMSTCARAQVHIGKSIFRLNTINFSNFTNRLIFGVIESFLSGIK